MGNNAIGSDYCSVADGHSWHDADVVSQPYMIADGNRSFAVQRALCERQTHVFANALPMAIVGNKHVGAC